MTYEEDLQERINAEVEDAKRMKTFNLLITKCDYASVKVEAHSLEEAKAMVSDIEEDEMDWFKCSWTVEEDE